MRNVLPKLLVAFVLLLNTVVFGQTTKVTGKVTDPASKEPLIGVTVANKTNGKRVLTDQNGAFSIEAKTGDLLQLTYVGYLRKEIKVDGTASISVELLLDESKLSDVVVTAFGIKRDKRGLGYSAQDIKGAEISETQRENFINSIQGRVAGATVTSTSGAPGASAQIVLRGFNSLSGSNSPLFIVDGLPVNNNSFQQGLLASDLPNRNDDYSNRGIDINPDDIESITVLKGPEATALYGIDAGSGAIVITTKKGRKGKLKLSYDNSFRIERNYRFPDVQTKYSTGVNGVYDSTTRSRFGPAWPDSVTLYDNINNFFNTGFSQKHNVNLEWGNNRTTYRANATWQDQFGVIPTTRFTRLAPRFTIDHKFTEKIRATGTAAYTHTDNRKAFRGAGGFMTNLLLWPNDDDVSIWRDANGNRRKYIDDPAFLEVDNPFWDVNRNKNKDRNDRYIFNGSITYDPLKWLSITARGGLDMFHLFGEYMYSPQSNSYRTVGGFAEFYRQDYRSLNGNLLATAKHQFGKLKTTVRVGTALDDYQTKSWSERAEGIGDVFDFFLSTNPTKRQNSRVRGRDTLTERRLIGVFGEIGLNYNDVWYINATGRQDQTSTLPEASRKFFYPSISTSFVFSEVLAPKSKWFNVGRIRASYAETAKDISPYSNQSVYTAQLTSGAGFGYGFTNNSPGIVPERQKTFEVGTELKFFNNRFGIDATYYHTDNIGQIVQLVRLSYGTGFILSTLNIADTKNEGVELVVNVTPIKTKNLTWRVDINAARNWNKVTYLPANVTEYYNSDSWIGNYRNGIVLNNPTTTLTGAVYLRNNNGDVLIDPVTGLGVLDPIYRIIGDRLPKVTFGVKNSITYKNWALNFLLDFRIGGDILNANEVYWTSVGLSKRTLDREVPRVIEGVLNDGLQNTPNPTKNTIQILPYQYQDYYTARSLGVDFMEKGVNWMWMRDITLRYSVKPSMLKKSKTLEKLSFFVTCTDPIVITNYSGLNPNANGNTPGTRGVGSFGIDFGTLPNPLGFNFGIITSFK